MDRTKSADAQSELFEQIRIHLGVEYEYETEIEDSQGLEVFTKEGLGEINIESSLKEKIIKATILGNINSISECIKTVEQSDSRLASYMQELLDEFEIERIRDIFL